MTHSRGQTGTWRQEEVREYVAAVREALADLPEPQRDELLEDLPAHLTEVAAEDPRPLTERLGPPAAYAAELRATVEPEDEPEAAARPGLVAGLRARWEQAQEPLGRWDVRVGRAIGYERFADFARLLLPAWWVLRGYLAAMLVVKLLDRQGGIGLLPRLGGSTLAGLVILAGFVAASIWLAHRTPGLGRWQQRALHLSSAALVLFGLVWLGGLDGNARWGWPGPAGYVADGGQEHYIYDDPYAEVTDVYAVDESGRLLTDVRLFDQYGRPLEIGTGWCEGANEEYDPVYDRYIVSYPRCEDEEELPWWARELPPATASPGPTPEPTAGPSLEPGPGLSPEPSPQPDPEGIPQPSHQPSPEPTVEGTPDS